MIRNRVRDVLTPEALGLIEAVHRYGSMAAAARELGVVPSALTYRIRQVEDALDVLLFDRSSRQARLTEAGKELLREGSRLLLELDAVANRVKRVATGWEPSLTLAVDSVISRSTVMELCEAFFALTPPTRLRLREEALSGTLEALTSGQADLAIGVAIEPGVHKSVQSKPLGNIHFIYAVAPHHPLALATEPVTDAMLMPHRAVAVADSVQRGSGVTVGLLGGQDIFTVPGMQEKLAAQLRGLGGGFLPEYLARPHIATGRLVEKRVQRAARVMPIAYAWRRTDSGPEGRALQWWLQQLARPATRQALLERDAAL
ncbi:MAG: LysR family transcriptional regulator [Polaromonas sp.]|uniref:LysR family transcriptional regulator n=1 Tax=Polaromonas sp. TaxID=1869339 RepID=UPI002731BEB1|nr:LysR family transcriptional regulator [Polaromonas sp.]MDP1739999.1 LysR family transcriptional regulator [Polaromonas sp.]MDP1956465.1 LysR family transcriptional regulator [Polaromonas sp.]MDP3355032.1 LysR family transcriptional regulator [Polaromonas sp.]MDP3797242.1 LysR family transcriptional regulator [Polaromonas sp.]